MFILMHGKYSADLMEHIKHVVGFSMDEKKLIQIADLKNEAVKIFKEKRDLHNECLTKLYDENPAPDLTNIDCDDETFTKWAEHIEELMKDIGPEPTSEEFGESDIWLVEKVQEIE